MNTSTALRAGALLTSLALLSLSASPALAAEPVARASATGAAISVGGQAQNTGTYAVTNDGKTESSTGSNKPAAGLLTGQTAVTFGTFAQDARTSVTGGSGSSLACAGAAGNGASVVAAGNASTCLTGGQNVTVSAGSLNLSGVSLAGTNPALAQIDVLLQPILLPVSAALNAATSTLFMALGNPAIGLSLGAVQSSCMADQNAASGTANIANATAFVDLPAFAGQQAQRVTLLQFPASPQPNTKVVTDLDAVADTILNALRSSLNSTASGLLQPLANLILPLNGVINTIQQQLVDGVVGQVANQLAPLQQFVLDGTLNRQTQTSANQIEVTALDLNVLPVIGSNSLQVQIGTSRCGPNGRVAAAVATPSASPKPSASPTRTSDASRSRNRQVPTSVPAGLASAPEQGGSAGPWVLAGLGGLLVLSFGWGAGSAALRRPRG